MFSTCWKSNFSLGFPSDLAGHKFPTGQGALNGAHEPHGHLKAHPELWNLSPMVPHVQPWLCSPASLTRIKFAEILVERKFQCCAHIPGSPSSSSSWRRRCTQAVIPRGWEHRINDRNAPSSPAQAGHIPLGRFPLCRAAAANHSEAEIWDDRILGKQNAGSSTPATLTPHFGPRQSWRRALGAEILRMAQT